MGLTYTINVDDAEKRLIDLLEKVDHGARVIFLKDGKPIAKLNPIRTVNASTIPEYAVDLSPRPKPARKPSDGIVWASARLSLDGGPTITKTDEELAAEQGLTVEQIDEARTQAMARVIDVIMSWPEKDKSKEAPVVVPELPPTLNPRRTGKRRRQE